VSASKPGYTNRQPLHASAERFDTGRDLTLRDRERAPHIELILFRESSIAGRIAEPDGIPAPDVQVFAAVRRGATYVRLEETRTVAEWNGRYRITGPAPGDYLVVILPGTRPIPNRMRANAERRAPESSSATRPFFEPTLYPGCDQPCLGRDRHGLRRHYRAMASTLAHAGRAAFDLRPHLVARATTTPENIVIEYANLTAQRSGLWTVPEPATCFVSPASLAARSSCSRAPTRIAVRWVASLTTEINVDESRRPRTSTWHTWRCRGPRRV
jgi:hypothetical protein